MPINSLESDIFELSNIGRISMFLINLHPADFSWTAGILVYSLKGNMPTSVLDKLLYVHRGSFNSVQMFRKLRDK